MIQKRMNIRVLGLLMAILLFGGSLAFTSSESDIEAMVKRAQKRRKDTRAAFLKIAEQKGHLCGPIPPKGPKEALEEKCLKGYDFG